MSDFFYKNVVLFISLCLQYLCPLWVRGNEQIVLIWDQAIKKIETPEGVLPRPYFEGAYHYKDDQYLPSYIYSLSGSSYIVSAELQDLFYIIADSAEQLLLKEIVTFSDFPATITQGNAGGMHQAVIKIIPFRINRDKRIIEKLVSFKIKLLHSSSKHYKSEASRGAHGYSDNSVLAAGEWIKVAVERSSMYKLTYPFIKKHFSIEPANLNFSQFGVFGNYAGMLNEVAGAEPKADDLKETPLYIQDNNNNGKFDADDFVLFYGESPHSWQYIQGSQSFVHQKHIYSDKNFYFITINKGSGKVAGTEVNNNIPNKVINTFDDFAFHDEDERNLLESGRLWLGNRMSAARTSVEINFSFPNILLNHPIRLVSAVAARTPQTTANNATQLSCNLGSSLVLTHTLKGSGSVQYGTVATYDVREATPFPSSDNIKLIYNYSSIDNTGEAYIDYIEINCKRQLTFTGSSMNFRSIESVASNAISRFEIENAGNARVWDVTDPFFAKNIPLQNGTFVASTDQLREFVVFNPGGALPEPEFIGKVFNQNLHACGQPDMVIVSHEDFLDEANRLADFHRQRNGLSVWVTTPGKIYNEFSSGKQDVTAIRNFLKMIYDRAAGDTALQPRYLLLFGDGSFDMKNRGSKNENFIPTYQSYESLNEVGTFVSDDFFGLLDDGEGGNVLGGNNFIDVAVGRLPVSTKTEAAGVVNKIIQYKSASSLGSWRNRLTFVADDEDYNVHLNDCNEFANYLAKAHPVYNQTKIYLDAYKRVNTSGGARYPDVNAAILNALNRGTLIMNYVGHGGVNNWAHERIFNFNEIRQLKNINTLPLFVTATCEFSRFDRSGGQTAGENLIVNPNGGGIASVTTVRIVYSYQNKQLNEALVKNLFKPYRGRMPTMGELLMEAKNSIWSGNDPNNRKFLLLGDPALTLNYPALEVATTEINGVPASQFNDTLKALQQVTLSGEVRYPNGTLATDFNGQLQATIFDKATTLTTLANSPGSFKAPFTVFNNIIFNGVASVVQGKFTISFIVPKDIDYRTGRARISYYAEDKQRNLDAHGLDTSMFIGGSLDTIALDNQGPTIQLFMNNENFRDGGITDANPALLALLQDDQGINLSSALGHQITAILDANTSSPIILNEYYRSELNDYRKGRVFYPFYNLADGPHTLTVKAWDSHNNSSEATISFIVTSTPALSLQNVFCYPNPSSSSVTFSFEHNAAQRPLDADVKIYTLQGNLVRNIKLQLTPDGYRQKNIYWEGDTDDGGQVQKGIYIYRITLTDNLGNNVSKSDKVVIVR